jgi:hypothetical protein
VYSGSSEDEELSISTLDILGRSAGLGGLLGERCFLGSAWPLPRWDEWVACGFSRAVELSLFPPRYASPVEFEAIFLCCSESSEALAVLCFAAKRCQKAVS